MGLIILNPVDDMIADMDFDFEIWGHESEIDSLTIITMDRKRFTTGVFDSDTPQTIANRINRQLQDSLDAEAREQRSARECWESDQLLTIYHL